jgi:hypothetical protein
MPSQNWGGLFTPIQQPDEKINETLSQPTGATTTGDGRKATQTIPGLKRVDEGPQPTAATAPSAYPSNTWTQIGTSQLRGSPPDPWIKPIGHDSLPGMSADQQAAMGAMLAHLAKMDQFFERMRKGIEPKPWAVVSAGGIGTGLQMGSIGAGTIYPTKCMLEGIHNPTSTPVTFSVTDAGSGDPLPKYSCTVGPGTTTIVGVRGMYFPHGIMLMSMTSGGSLTFFGSDSAE